MECVEFRQQQAIQENNVSDITKHNSTSMKSKSSFKVIDSYINIILLNTHSI